MTHFIATDDGHFVSSDFAYLAEVIEDYDPNLELRWIPPDNRKTPHEQRNPWAVTNKNGYVIFLCSDKDKPYEILARIIDGDQRRGDILQRIDAKERAQEILQAKKQMEAMEEAKDEIRFLVGNANHGKNYLMHKGRKLDGTTLKEIPGSRRAYLL